MPLDAVVVRALAAELRDELLNMKIDKVFQPEKDELVLSLRGARGSLRLLLSAGGSHPRVYITKTQKENPSAPPMLCMLMRKHLCGGIIREVSNEPMERVIHLDIDTTDEFGDPSRKRLTAELIGRHSNIILTGADGRIIDCLRRVDSDMSGARQVLPGLFYRLPPGQQDKRDPLTLSHDEIRRMVDDAPPEAKADEWLLSVFLGLSPLVCREIAFLSCGDVSPRFFEFSDRKSFSDALCRVLGLIENDAFKPYMLRKNGAPADICFMPVSQYSGVMEGEEMPGFSALLDTFYAQRDAGERMRQRSQDMTRTVSSARDRLLRKLVNQEKELESAKDRESLRRLGDLLTANLHLVRRGAESVTVDDFYSEEGEVAEIRLNPKLSPQQNAARFYKDYSRMKNAEKMLFAQIEAGKAELFYLESVLGEISLAESDSDLQGIRSELGETGYLKKAAAKKRGVPALRPLRFRSEAGFLILVGRNNLQNDELTLKLADKNDVWLHTQKIHGAHVIISCGSEAPDDLTVTQAAMLAAYYSKARGGAKVPVDYTIVRNVKKPPGARPGGVIYKDFKTAFVTPDQAAVAELHEKAGG